MTVQHSFKKAINVGEISVSGGKLAEDQKFKIEVVLGFDGLSLDQAIKLLAESSSPRVKLQKVLRENTSASTLEKLEKTGLAVHVNDVTEPMLSDEEKRQKAVAAILAVMPGATVEQVEAFINANTPK